MRLRALLVTLVVFIVATVTVVLTTTHGGPPAGADIGDGGWHTVGSSGEPAFDSDVSQTDDFITGGDPEWTKAYNDVQYRLTADGEVELRGSFVASDAPVSLGYGGGDGAPWQLDLFTLPCGYRPNYISGGTVVAYNLAGPAESYPANIQIDPDGQVSYIFYQPTVTDDEVTVSSDVENIRFDADNAAYAADPGSCTDAEGITTTTAG